MTPPSPGPIETRSMPVRPGKRRFQPRAQKRIRYYWASMILACVFVLLAVAFPFWLDWVRHQNADTPIDAIPKEFAVPPPRDDPGTTQPGPGAVPRDGNSQCRGYVAARCNALGIRPEACDRILVSAMAVPVSEGMDACRKAVDPLIKEAGPSSLIQEAPNPPRPDVLQATDVPAPVDVAVTVTGAASADVPVSKDAGKTAQAEPLPVPGSRLSAEKRAEVLARMATLVEELQLASQNYGTLPAAQAARLAELRSLAQAEGSPEVIEVYNNLIKRYQKPEPRPGGTVSETPRVEAGSGFSAEGPGPELGHLRAMASEARKQAGGPAEPPPSREGPPRSISPSEVQAPPSVSP